MIQLNSQTQFFSVEGAQLALDYQCGEEPPTQLLVLVNGFQRSRLDFRAFRKKIHKLCPHVATVAFDNRYCGETIVESPELSIEIMAKDIQSIAKAFCEKLDLHKYSVLGISMGGMISQMLAGSIESNHLENLFLVSTTCGGEGRTWPASVKDPSKIQFREKNTDLESTKANMRRYFGDQFLKGSPLLFDMMCKNIYAAAQKDSKNSENASRQFDVSHHFNGVPFLRQISAEKTVVISGDEDHIIPVQNAFYLSQHIQNSELIIYPHVGHLILIEEPEKFVTDVSAFFLQRS